MAAEAAAAAGEAEEEPQALPKYAYGFDEVVQKVYRGVKRGNGKFKKMEYAIEVKRQEGGKDADPVMAFWEDGDKQEISDLLNMDWGNMEKVSKKAPTELWVGECRSNHHRLTLLTKKKNRTLLVILREQGRQILLQVPVKTFGD